MSQYKPYPAYKDSGVEWLGQVPEHWNIVPLKWCFECLDGKRVPLNSEQRADIKGEVPYWGSGGVVDHIEKFIFDEPLVLLGEDGAPFFDRDRPVAYAIKGKSWINNHIHVLRPLTDYPIAWFVHALNCVEYRHYIDGSTRDKLTQDDMKSISLVIPGSSDEASQAVAHLDRETARIDALVAKKTRFIELLREKRQALITHAVTKGLDPNVKMKDSGVEWLGEVPEHWSKPMSLLSLAKHEQHSFVNGPFGSDLLTTELTTEGVPVVYIRDIRASAYRRVSEVFVSPEKAEQLRFCNVLPGDVIISKVGDPPGIAAVYPAGEQGGIVTQDVMRLRVDKQHVEPEFLAMLINSDYGRFNISQVSVESTRLRVGLGDFKQLKFTIPSVVEQRTILAALQPMLAQIDALMDKTANSITLLKERRSALITAAVTGQIDLRESV